MSEARVQSTSRGLISEPWSLIDGVRSLLPPLWLRPGRRTYYLLSACASPASLMPQLFDYSSHTHWQDVISSCWEEVGVWRLWDLSYSEMINIRWCIAICFISRSRACWQVFTCSFTKFLAAWRSGHLGNRIWWFWCASWVGAWFFFIIRKVFLWIWVYKCNPLSAND